MPCGSRNEIAYSILLPDILIGNNANFEKSSKVESGERVYDVDYDLEPVEVVEVEEKEAPANVDKETGEIKVDKQSGLFDDDFEPVKEV